MEQPITQPKQLTSEDVKAALNSLFYGLQDTFDSETESGAVRAFETIVELDTMVRESPDMVRWLFSGENLKRLQALQAKSKSGKNIGFNDLATAFPDLMQNLIPGFLKL